MPANFSLPGTRLFLVDEYVAGLSSSYPIMIMFLHVVYTVLFRHCLRQVTYGVSGQYIVGELSVPRRPS